MNKLSTSPTITSAWHKLVHEASNANSITLTEDLSSYLVFMLIRFTDSPDIVHKIMGQELLKSAHKTGTIQQNSLREVGDTCLLFTGLFPEIAQKRNVNLSYYVKLGKTAYSELSSHKTAFQETFSELHNKFVSLMDILQSMRELDTDYISLTPIQAMDLWQECDSKHALKNLKSSLNNENIVIQNDFTNKLH